MVKPPVRLEAGIIEYIDGSPWGLSGFATGHPPLPGYRRFIQWDEIREFDAELSCAETTSVAYDLRYQVEDVVADSFGILRQARILVARLGALRNEWRIHCGLNVIEHVWASQFYEDAPRLLALASEPHPLNVTCHDQG